MTSIIWRRLDAPGHDACWLQRTDSGWQLEGAAVFRHDGVPARLAYRLSCDAAWRSRQGRVEGRVGTRAVEFDLARTADRAWLMNGTTVPGLESCLDLDFGFTPATNVLPLRRLNLATGESAEAPAAWLDADGRLQLLPQRYERRSETTYWYESPTVGYAALLEVEPGGFTRRYPGLWEAEP